MKKTIGILAHVDAGKTTFSEQVLYRSRAIRSLGRVDHRDAFLDAHPLEKQRGITIFSGQACFQLGDDTLYWLDTPGHVDFSTEMERAVAVMDYAILVVSCAEGVQSHTETVWRLLESYGVPVFIFLNKIDRAGADPDAVIEQMRKRLSPDILDMRTYQVNGEMDEPLQEAVAAQDETLLDALFTTGYDAAMWHGSLREQIKARRCFPVMAGAALEGRGVGEFLACFTAFTSTNYDPSASFAAQCYRVRHEAQGTRLCFLKLLRGSLHVKDELSLPDGPVKVNELRVYHGEKFHAVDQAEAGDIVAIPGLEGIKPGDRIGMEGTNQFRTIPMMASDVIWNEKDVPAFRMMQALRILEDEDPSLAVEEARGHISVHVMGRIQLEVLRQLMLERYGYAISFGPFRVLYKETISAPAIGWGHYEPLRHYAEVMLRLVPTAPGSGVTFRSLCHVDDLSLNWQRLIAGHVSEKQHKGVLTGAPLTDVCVELLAGRAHLKHTEGGDFRQAVYRGIRNALMHADSVLLEPVCGFSITAPSEQYGTLSGALTRMQAQVEPPEYAGDTVLLRGEAVFSVFAAWQEDFMAATRGRGSLQVWMSRYAPCREQQTIVESSGYNPCADDSPDSVFCAKGAGFTVPWDQVKNYAHTSWEE
ncbi:MAG: TetM/TetW/TetO/TetS family tetracycline resistance ribosomal protection protein [Clostridiales bacterium]|nr:TetM/TetW/TetO/TetS family tetracycline resistance ribosomal protection protein [Clostridiales bacterium]